LKTRETSRTAGRFENMSRVYVRWYNQHRWKCDLPGITMWDDEIAA
jgi:hypothetical protein